MSERIEKWDILKFGLIFFVVLGHIASHYTEESAFMRSLYLFIYIFHMPVFIFVSGLFSKRTVDELRWDKITGYLLIYLFSKLLYALYCVIDVGKFRFSFSSSSGYPWFMFAIAVFPIITHYLKRVKPSYVLIISLVISLLAGYDGKVGDFFSISRILVFFPFYYLGYLLKPGTLQEITSKSWVKIASLAVIIVTAVLVFTLGDMAYSLRPMFTARNPYSVLGDFAVFGPIFRLFCYVSSFVLGFAFIAITPNKSPVRVVSTFGARTLSVYVYHRVVIYLLFNQFYLKEFLQTVLPQGLHFLAIFVLALIITVVLSLKPFINSVNAIYNVPKHALKKD